MKTDTELQDEVAELLKWESMLRSSEIFVSANNGIITLTGKVNSYAKKTEADGLVRNTNGVKFVFDHIQIQPDNGVKKEDWEISDEIGKAFAVNWELPNEKIAISVDHGCVFLQGDVEWDFQKHAAGIMASTVAGVVDLCNEITVRHEKSDFNQTAQRDGFFF